MLVITASDGAELERIPLNLTRISARLGNLNRTVAFPNGARFETADNDGMDAMLRAAKHLRGGSLIDRMERSLRWVAIAVAIAAVSVYAFIMYGIPAAALGLAVETPPSVLTMISDGALGEIDRLMKPSKLKTADRIRARHLFERVAAQGKSGLQGYHLVFRGGGVIGANAFSLPDGTVVMTDELYALVKKDDELEGVFGHEIAHADRRHALQAVYEAAIVPAAIALITGDLTQFGHIATLLPGVLIQSAYSRDLEQQADDDSAVVMRRIGADPGALGDLLERMEKKECGKDGCGPSWLGDHPDTAARAAKLRSERASAKR
jgi:Zn-dependent protease with chaperone function